MGKLILGLVLAFVVWRMWRKLQVAGSDRPAAAAAPRPAEAIVACAHCGVHQPRSECIESRGRVYCSAAHRRLAEEGRGDAG